MITLDKLKTFGADTEDGLQRCYGNEALYLKLIGKLQDEKNFDNLKNAIDAHDIKAAFDASHAIKGVLGNLSLTPMTAKASEITELLRAGQDIDYSGLLKELFDMKDELAKLCED